MLSYALIFLAVFALLSGMASARKQKVTPDDPVESEEDARFIQAMASYETPQWKMAVVTDMKMSQADWNNTLQVLTSNIENLERTR